MTGLSEGLHPRGDVAEEWFDDAVLIWDPTTRRLHHLDLHAAAIWAELDGRPVADVVATLADQFAVGPEVLHEDVVAVCDRLLAEGLVTRTST